MDKVAEAVNNLSMASRNLNDATKDMPPMSPLASQLLVIREEIISLELKLLHLNRGG